MSLVLGIDPGLKKTGWGIVKKEGTKLSFIACGLITTDEKERLYKRLKFICDNLQNVLSEFKPDVASLEETFVNKNALSSLKLGFVRGAIMLLIANNHMPLEEYSTNLIKKTLTSSGFATKEQIARMIKILLPNSTAKSEDESDALATAICYINHN